jgi:hypothetical protein
MGEILSDLISSSHKEGGMSSARTQKPCKGQFWGQINSVAIVRKRTIPTERPPLVGEVSANFCGYRVLRGQRNEFPRPLISVV